jgi:hypothetical protein
MHGIVVKVKHNNSTLSNLTSTIDTHRYTSSSRPTLGTPHSLDTIPQTALRAQDHAMFIQIPIPVGDRTNGLEICRTCVFNATGIAGIVWVLECVNLNSMANYIYIPMQCNYVVC